MQFLTRTCSYPMCSYLTNSHFSRPIGPPLVHLGISGFLHDVHPMASSILEVLAMKGLPPSQKEERGLDLKKKCLGSMAEPAGR